MAASKERRERFDALELAPLGQCGDCMNYDTMERNCTAFPDGIPASILRGDHDHRKTFPGDKGIRFTPYPSKGKK